MEIRVDTYRRTGATENSNIESSSYIAEINKKYYELITISGLYPDSEITIKKISNIGGVKWQLGIGDISKYLSSDKEKILNIDEASQYLKSIFDYMKYRLQTSETYGKKFQGLPDEVILDYFKRITDSGTVEQALEKENMILVNDLRILISEYINY